MYCRDGERERTDMTLEWIAPSCDSCLVRKRLHNQKVSLDHVAARARVSTASVSRVLNGSSTVSAELHSRVRRAADELGYVPNGAARALSSRRSRAIGAVVPTVENTGFATAVAALQRRL